MPVSLVKQWKKLGQWFSLKLEEWFLPRRRQGTINRRKENV